MRLTIEEAKKALVSWCNAQIGYREGENNWNKYAQELDKINGLTWGAKQCYAWCGEFVLAAFVANFGVDLGLKLQYSPMPTSIPLCRDGAQYYKVAGAFVRSPQVGDVIFFWRGSEINHTGIVVNVGMGAITTVEGNSSDMVARRTYDVNDSQIAGYGRPNWALVEGYEPSEDAPDVPEAPPQPDYLYHTYQYTVRVHLLKLGDYGAQVRSMQSLLRSHGYDCTDKGEFDDATYNALVKFQSDCGITADGEFGGESFDRLYNYGG